jgi:hypothetical protein
MKNSTDEVWANLMETPRWARDFDKLSKGAQKKLRGLMSPNESRQISTGRHHFLGDGAEKTVYKSLTGGKDSATAVMRPRPLVPPIVKSPSGSLDNTTLPQRYKMMQELERKGVGVRMYKEHPKGYTMERMRPTTAANARAVKQLGGKLRRMSPYYQGVGNSHPDYPHAKVNFGNDSRVLADISHKNVMVDRKGRAKITDALFLRHKDLAEAEYIPGGKAEGMCSSRFPKKQLRMGRKVEMEHTRNPRVAEEIAKDHLAEFNDYYTRLARMERMAKRSKGAR